MDEREKLGRLVREIWVQWASEHPDPKPSWLTGWDELDEGQREVDMRIGEALAAREREVRRLIYSRYRQTRRELAEIQHALNIMRSDRDYWQSMFDGVTETLEIAERVITAVSKTVPGGE